ncbi:MAG: Virginiamycin B lyase [Syntrophus sp. SKADARSKE-3]|nr:Virginiamycin B lyase [Syntrophus sp. SKADARSKE-3]
MKFDRKQVLFLALLSLVGWGWAAFSHAAPYAYITNSGDSTVSVIDTANNTVKTTVTVGTQPLGVAVHPQGKYVYVANYASNTVSIIDVVNNHTVINTIPVGSNPYGIAVNAAGTYAYVANSGANTVSVIDLTQKVVSGAPIPVGGSPMGIAVNPSGAYVYVTNNQSNTLSVIDTTTNTVKTTINVGSSPLGVAVAPSGAYVYVANTGSNNVSVVNTSTYTIATITSAWLLNPLGIAVNPAGTLGYITSQGKNLVSVFDMSTNLVTNNIYVGTNPIGVTVNMAGTYAYIVNNGAGTVSVLDTITNTIQATPITVGTSPYGFGVFTASYGPTPSVSSTLPKANATGASIGTYILATFTNAIDPTTKVIDPLSAMDPSTITAATFLMSGGITGTVTYDSVNRIATFKPNTILLKNTAYTATLTTGIKNMAGNPLAANYTWSFTTSNDDSGTGCFIATAAYGSYDDVQVKVLRTFRDRYLLPHPWGAAMVHVYYRYSPPIADVIRSNPSLRAPVRWALAPVIFGIQYPSMIALSLGLVVIGGIGLNQRRRVRSSSRKEI